MGWKGAVRSINASIREAERDAKRKQKELEKQHKQIEKMHELEQAAYEVDVYENYIEVIQSIHKECSPAINWSDIASSPQPLKPNNSTKHADKARLEEELYKPSFTDRLFKREKQIRLAFAENIAKAIQIDDLKNKSNLIYWEKAVEDWKESIGIANSLLQGEAKAKIEAIEKLQPFSEISNLGSKITISIADNGLVEATIHVHSSGIVPNEIKNLLKSGKLSVKNMPKGKFNEIYQDYVCSCILRVANELFSIISDKIVIITAVDELLNSKTGHLEVAAIVSVAVSRNTLINLNLKTIDPSDSMENFVHNMSFKKTKGFERVDRINSKYLEL